MYIMLLFWYILATFKQHHSLYLSKALIMDYELDEQRRRDIFEAYEKALKHFGEMAKYISKDVIIEHAMTYKAPRFYISYEIARRSISDMTKGRSPRAHGPQKEKMYKDIFARFIESSKQEGSFAILKQIIEEPADSFYISKKRFSRIVYQELRR